MSNFRRVERGTEVVLTAAGRKQLRSVPKLQPGAYYGKDRKAYFEGICRRSDLIRVRLEGNQQAEIYAEEFWKKKEE